MDPTFEDIESFAILGITCRSAPDQIDYEGEWRRFDRHLAPAKKLALDDQFYAGYFIVESQGELVDFFAGVAVPVGTTSPNDEMVVRDVPGGCYAVFTCTMATLSQTWASIYGDWRPPEGTTIDHTRPDLEVFPAEGSPEDAPIRILVPVKTS